MILGDALHELKALDANSIDSVITDPPYGLSQQPDIAEVMGHWLRGDIYSHATNGFMGKSWDSFVPGPEYWREVFRVMKPGAHLLAFGGTRTYDLLANAIRFGGFEIRDCILWHYGSGFPKSLNVQKQICNPYECQLLSNVRLAENQYPLFPVELNEGKIVFAAVGALIHQGGEQESKTVTGVAVGLCGRTVTSLFATTETIDLSTISSWKTRLEGTLSETKTCITATELETITGLKIWNCLRSPNTLDAMQTSAGLGTALKPATEIICLARKPLSEKTVAANVLKWGTGGLNIDATRIGTESRPHIQRRNDKDLDGDVYGSGINGSVSLGTFSKGRFPANVILDEVAGGLLDEQSGVSKSAVRQGGKGGSGLYKGGFGDGAIGGFTDSGGASRFFYCAKASKSERNRGLEGMPEKETYVGHVSPTPMRDHREQVMRANHHPTVKPVALMEYLIKLITPPNGIVLDPFMGSGTTGVACKRLGFNFTGIELNDEYFEIAKRRIEAAAFVPPPENAQLEIPT